jgi:hypothetical protein
MKKIKVVAVIILILLLTLVLFVGKTNAQEIEIPRTQSDDSIEDLIKEQNILCTIFKDQSERLADIFDEILKNLNPEQELYQEVIKFSNLTKKTGNLIKEIEELLKNIRNQKDENLFWNILEIDTKCIQVGKTLNYLVKKLEKIFIKKSPTLFNPEPDAVI